MSDMMEDALESGWVSVRPNVFEEKEKHKFVFIVAWNDVEGKFAVTCHDRTVQKRTAVRDSACDVTEPEQRTGSPDGPRQNRKRSDRSAARGTHAESPRDTGEDSQEVLDDLDRNLREHSSWAGLFSFNDVRSVHVQLCAVNSDLEPCLPAFPEERTAVWSVLFGVPELDERRTQALCYQLHVYLGHALDTCGWKILAQVLFPDAEDSQEYYESLSELRHKGFREALHRSNTHLQQV